MLSQGNCATPLQFSILGLIEPETAPFNLPTMKTQPKNQTWSGSDDPLWRYGHSKFDISRLTRGAFEPDLN